MSDFVTILTGFVTWFWEIISSTTIDLATVISRMDEFLFNYTPISGILIVTFMLAKQFPNFLRLAGNAKSQFQQYRLRRKGVPMNYVQQGGAAGGDVASTLLSAMASNPQLASQVAAEAAKNKTTQQPIAQPVAQPVAQPINMPKARVKRFQFKPIARNIRQQGKSNIIILLMIFIIHAIEYSQECDGDFEFYPFIRSSFWTIIFTYFITMILINVGPYYMIKRASGEGFFTNLIDGVILCFVYNLVRNWRNITDKNTCKDTTTTSDSTTESESTSTDETPAEAVENATADTPDEESNTTEAFTDFDAEVAIKSAAKEEANRNLLKQSNQIKTTPQYIPEAQMMLKDENIIVGRSDLYRAIDNLLKKQKQITTANLKAELNVTAPLFVKSQTQQEIDHVNVLDRRHNRGEYKPAELPIDLTFAAVDRNIPSPDDEFIYTERGRLLGINPEKVLEEQNLIAEQMRYTKL